MLTPHRITRRADDDGVDAGVVERDYVLAHIVAQLPKVQMPDSGRLVFKGGTALRFVHVQDYRYSADLDFTVLGGTAEVAAAALSEAVAAAKEHAGFPTLMLEKAEGSMLKLEYVGPLGAKPRAVKVDLALDEYVESVVQGEVLPHIWDDLPSALPFDIYPLSEIAAEKLRCVIQRVQCRDIYDLLRLTEGLKVELRDIRDLFESKARIKALDPASFREKFEDRAERYGERWDREMGEHLAEPPRLDDVLRIVRRHLRAAELI